MSHNQIQFRVIPKETSSLLCNEFDLQKGNLYSEYRSQTSKQIDITCPPDVCGDVGKDGNCLYRAICLEISGSEVSYRQIKQWTASSLDDHRDDFVAIGEDQIDKLIESAQADGVYGEESHLIALSVCIRIPIYVFNRTWTPPQWDTMSTELKPNCHPIQVNLNINMLLFQIFILNIYLNRCVETLEFTWISSTEITTKPFLLSCKQCQSFVRPSQCQYFLCRSQCHFCFVSRHGPHCINKFWK